MQDFNWSPFPHFLLNWVFGPYNLGGGGYLPQLTGSNPYLYIIVSAVLLLLQLKVDKAQVDVVTL